MADRRVNVHPHLAGRSQPAALWADMEVPDAVISVRVVVVTLPSEVVLGMVYPLDQDETVAVNDTPGTSHWKVGWLLLYQTAGLTCEAVGSARRASPE
jgi:hypothetical protein